MATKRVSDEDVIAAYERFGHLGQAAAEVGLTKSTLHGRLMRLGVSTARARAWTPAEDGLLCGQYQAYRAAGKVRDLAETLDRTLSAVTSRAYSLGLTDPGGGRDGAAREVELSAYSRSGAERHRAVGMLMAMGAVDLRFDVLVLAGDPMSKARSRFSRTGKSYTPASVKEAEARWQRRLAPIRPYMGNVAVSCIFVRADNQRIDVDNMVKLVMDACTAAKVWDDDSQVTALAAVEERDPWEPRTVLALAPHQSTMRRGSEHWPTCPVCEKQFNPAGRRRAVYCSQECRSNRPVAVP